MKSDFDSFLEEYGILEHCTAVAIKRVEEYEAKKSIAQSSADAEIVCTQIKEEVQQEGE